MIKARERFYHGREWKTGLSNPWDSRGGQNPRYVKPNPSSIPIHGVRIIEISHPDVR